jgi:hypothetical protein
MMNILMRDVHLGLTGPEQVLLLDKLIRVLLNELPGSVNPIGIHNKLALRLALLEFT